MIAASTSHRPTFTARVATLVLRHRLIVVALWAVLLVSGGIAAPRLSQRLGLNFSLPGQPGYVTAKQITQTYGNGGQTTPAIIVVTVPAGQTVSSDQTAIGGAFDRVRQAMPQLRVVDYAATHDPRFVTRDGRTTFAYVFVPQAHGFPGPSPLVGGAIKVAASALPGYQLQRTGLEELSSSSSSSSSVLTETLIGVLGALAVLAFVFASLLALVPLVIAGVSILTTLLIVFGLSYVTDVSLVVQFLVALMGLGIAIDYSLLLVTRWREERGHGLSNREAVVAAMATAGRSVLLSGLTVTIGLLALIVLPVPELRSVGYGGVLIPLVSVLVSLTLLPVLLDRIGPRVDWPRPRHASQASRPWTRWASLVVRHKVVSTVAGLAILGVLIIPLFSLTTGQAGADALTHSGSAYGAYVRLVDGGVPTGVLTPFEALTSNAGAAGAQRTLTGVPGIATVARSQAPDSNRAGTTVLVAIPNKETVNSKSIAPVKAARVAIDGAPGVVGIAGVGPLQLDYQNAVFGNFPLMFAVIAVLTFLLLARAFRSVVLAAKAVALNMLSVAATFGLLTFFWQQGHGSKAIFNIPATGAITFWVPIMIFAFLFGLSMDYEVFILTRLREEYDRTGSTNQAVIGALGRTGRLVTSAALILFLAFASLATTLETDIKIMATGLGVGILLDATVVRGLLLPALVALFGRWNWWMPRPLARVLAVRRPPTSPAAEPNAAYEVVAQPSQSHRA